MRLLFATACFVGLIGLSRVHEATGAPVYVHADDLNLYQLLEQQAAWLGWKTPKQVQIDQVLREGDSIRWGGCEAQIIHTPGHTPGSICLYVPADRERATPEAARVESTEPGEGLLFAGDTLFAGSIGRTDLWGGSFPEIMRSLKLKLLELPDSTVVYPGHGEATTIGQEREANPFLRGT